MPRWMLGVGAVCLALFAGLALWQAATKSETYDEPMYILSGYSYVATGDLSLNREHPPLAKYLMGLALQGLDLQLPPDYQARPGIPFAFLAHQPHASAPQIVFRARLPFVALGLVLLLYVWRWAALAFGPAAGLAALVLAALNPNLLAHAAIAANDFSVTVFGFAACYHAWRWFATGRRASLLLAALVLGLGLGSKLTVLMLLPVLGLVALGVSITRRRLWPVGGALLALFAAGGVVWLLYGGEARSLSSVRDHPRYALPDEGERIFRLDLLEHGLPALFGQDTPVPLLSFLKGVDLQLDHARAGHVNYWRGVNSREGSKLFYAASWLMKNPEGFSLLLLLGLVAWRRTWRGAAHEALLLGFPLLIFVVFSTSKVQLGFKYILPAVPFLCVAASRVLAPPEPGVRERRVGAALMLLATACLVVAFHEERRVLPGDVLSWTATLVVAWLLLRRGAAGRGLRPAGAALVIWASLASLARQPHDLMYFNAWVGGPTHGWKWSVIGDDWGQDTALLGRWMEEHDVESVRYDYYGTGDPEAWGVRSRPTFAHPRQFEPFAGHCAVHVTLLGRFPEHYFWLRDAEPVARLGHTIFVYHLSEEHRAATAAELAARDAAASRPGAR